MVVISPAKHKSELAYRRMLLNGRWKQQNTDYILYMERPFFYDTTSTLTQAFRVHATVREPKFIMEIDPYAKNFRQHHPSSVQL